MKPLTFWNKIGYGAGALTENNVQNVVNIMLPLIMFNYMGVSPILLGYVFAIARLWDTVTDPLMGYLSDRTRSRFGKRKPYILVGAVMSAFSFWLIWMFPEGKSQMWYFWYLTATCLLYFWMTFRLILPADHLTIKCNFTGSRNISDRLPLLLKISVKNFSENF